MRLAIVGNGNIAKFHVEAFSVLGLKPKLLISRDGSNTAVSFKNKYSIDNLIEEKQFFKKKIISELDGVIIACNTENTAKYVDFCQQNNIWTLTEKPVSFDIDMLALFSNFKKCMVAFNRRYYPNIKYLKSIVDQNKNKKIFIDMYLPEKKIISDKFGTEFYQIFNNSIHGIDLLFYLFNDINVLNVQKVVNNGSKIVVASDDCFDLRINFLLNSPINFSVKIYGLENFYDLTPFEVLTIYKDLEYCPPSKNFPISRYLPKIHKVITANNNDYPNIKPGFYEQSKTFIKAIKGNVKQNFPNIEDALNSQKLLQNIYKDVIK